MRSREKTLAERPWSAPMAAQVEIFARAQRRHEGAREHAVVLDQDCGWQVLRVGVDGVAEQHQLHERDEDHRRKRDAVAPELDQLLDEGGVEAAEGHHRGLTRNYPSTGSSDR